MGTLLNMPGKTKDNLKSRLDLVEMRLRKDLHPKQIRDKYQIPRATFTLSPEERNDVVPTIIDNDEGLTS